MNKEKIKASASETFEAWSDKVKGILNKLPKTTTTGEPLEYTDDEYQNILKMLEQCSMNFEDFPIYPINETIANKLIQDQLRGYEYAEPNI
jgi:hypothetical protein